MSVDTSLLLLDVLRCMIHQAMQTCTRWDRDTVTHVCCSEHLQHAPQVEGAGLLSKARTRDSADASGLQQAQAVKHVWLLAGLLRGGQRLGRETDLTQSRAGRRDLMRQSGEQVEYLNKPAHSH